MGDSESMGFLAYALTKQDECHYRCSLALSTLCNLLDRGINPQAELFIKVTAGIPVNSFSKLCFSDHVVEKGMKKCKDLSLKVLNTFLVENPLIRPQQIIGHGLAKEYFKWLQSKRQDPSAAYFLPQDFTNHELTPNTSDEVASRRLALRRPDNREINTNISERSLRLCLFKEKAQQKWLHKAKERGQLRTAYKELELVNHEMIFLSINGATTSRKNSTVSPLKKGVKRATHDVHYQVVELSIVDGKSEYQTTVQYGLKRQLSDSTRVYSINSLSRSAASEHQFNSISVKSERKHSNNLSLSTNCDDSIEQFSPTKVVTCLFEGELRLSFVNGTRLDWIELNQIGRAHV